MNIATAIAIAGLLLGSTLGAWLLRRSWQRRDTHRRAVLLAGWSSLLAVMLISAHLFGPARGTFVAFTMISVCALLVVASGLQIRNARASRRATSNEGLAPEPLERDSVWWRTTLRWLLAGPIGMLAAIAVGICYSVWAPGAPQTRLLIGGLLVPIVWGGGMAWTLSDNRVLRATAVLVGTAVVGFTASILKGFT
ncbi:MAG: hypothetical protein ABW171_03975 [Steroidobacter sp.]